MSVAAGNVINQTRGWRLSGGCPTVTCEGVRVSGQTLGRGAEWYLTGSDVQSSSAHLVGILEVSTCFATTTMVPRN
jgi:hypothetical protein